MFFYGACLDSILMGKNCSFELQGHQGKVLLLCIPNFHESSTAVLVSF